MPLVDAPFVNQLHFGDNLERLRHGGIADKSVDLVSLDPPFNSARSYNLLFKSAKGEGSPAQIEAFTDTWTYSRAEYERVMEDDLSHEVHGILAALHAVLGKSEMMAYVTMMAPRVLALHKKLKPTGSLYLHCDPVGSHYLKLVLDVIFGPENSRTEISWRRSSAHNDAAQGRKAYGNVRDTILFYAKGRTRTSKRFTRLMTRLTCGIFTSTRIPMAACTD